MTKKSQKSKKKVIYHFRARDHATGIRASLKDMQERGDYVESIGWILAEDSEYFYIVSGSLVSDPEDDFTEYDITKLLKAAVVEKRRVK